MAKQTKPFKLEPETYDKLLDVINDMKEEDPKVEWDSCFDAMTRAYKAQTAAAIAERPAEEKDFRATINRAVDMYIAALGAITATEDRVKQDAAKKIEAASAAASTLQEKIAGAEARAEAAEADAKAAQDETERLQEALEATGRRADAAELTLSEQRESNKLLSDRLVELEKKLAGYEETKEKADRADALEKELADVKKQAEIAAKFAAQTAAAELREAVAAERERYAIKLAEMLDKKAEKPEKDAPKKPAAKKATAKK